MTKPDEEKNDQSWFDEQLKDAVAEWDKAHAPQTPDYRQLEALVEGHKQEMRKRLWMDLLLLWLVASCILLFMLWMIDRSLLWFVILQASIALGGAAVVTMTYGRRRAGLWRN